MNAGKDKPWGWWWPNKLPQPVKRPLHTLYGYQLYTPPPKFLRYTLERWSYEDEQSNRWAGETYAPTYCPGCCGTRGEFTIGEYVIDDSQSKNIIHIRCASRKVRLKAWLGSLVCTLLAVLCIDRFAKHVV